MQLIVSPAILFDFVLLLYSSGLAQFPDCIFREFPEDDERPAGDFLKLFIVIWDKLLVTPKGRSERLRRMELYLTAFSVTFCFSLHCF